MQNSGPNSYGTWVRGVVDDRTIITSLLDVMDNRLPNGYEITDIKIVRRPPEPNDYDVMEQLGFTAIKAHYHAK